LRDKVEFLDGAMRLAGMGCELFASAGTAEFLAANGVSATALRWPLEGGEPNIGTMLRAREFDLVINIPKNNGESELENDYLIRRMAVDFDVPLVTDIKVARQLTEALVCERERGLEIKSWEEYR
jgi:carbamoyl-phosphate synthase large subunit